jgi:hypothetical protein
MGTRVAFLSRPEGFPMRNTWVSRLASLSMCILGAQLPARGQSTPEIAVTLFHDRPLDARLEVKVKHVAPPRVLEWTFGDGTAPSAEPAPLHTFPRLDFFPMKARVVDASGAQSTLERTINLVSPPYIEITGAGEAETAGGNALWFTAEVHAGRKPPEQRTFRWDFGDGATATGGRVEHLYAAAGAYLVTVRVNKNPTTTLTDGVEVKVTIASTDPLPAPPPPAPEPPRLTLTTSYDFESTVSSLDGVVFRRVVDSSLAHAGAGCLEVSLTQSASFHNALTSSFGGALLPFFLADRIDAKWWCRWEAALALDASRIAATIDEYLASAGAGLTAAQTQRVRTLAAAVAAQLGAGVALEGQRWYCLSLRYVFPREGVTTGLLSIAADGRVLVSLDGIAILDDGPILGALVNVLLAGKVITSNATKCWMDDLLLTTEGASCP